MDRLNQVNIKQEEDNEQKEISVDNEEKQQNNKGTLSRHDNTSHSNINIKQEFDDEHKKVKNIAQQQNSVGSCTKVKKEVEGGECKVEWDGDECDCDQCRVEREVKIEFSQNNATNNQQTNSYGPSQANEVGLCKHVKKEEDESAELKDEWDEDCDCDDCRRMRLKAIRLEQTNVEGNGGTGGDDGEETEIVEEGNGDEDVLVGNDGNMTVDDQIDDENGDELDQEGEQSGDGQESSEDQISDGDDETEIDDEEYEMEVDGDDEETEQFRNHPIHGHLQPNGQIVQIEEEEDGDVETEIEDNEGDEKESRNEEDARIKISLPHSNGQTRKIVRQSARYFKRNQTEDEIATESTTNPIQPNRHLQCPHCLKSFNRKFNLETHLRVHSGERPFPCGQCNKRFNDRSTLANHQLIHQNIKRFRCDECEKKFTLKRNLDSHLLIHSGERPFACRHCEKSFAELGNRTKHEQAIHLHVKPNRCKQCGHTATTRSQIIKHIRTVHFGLPHTIKEQKALNIIDERDPRELIEKV